MSVLFTFFVWTFSFYIKFNKMSKTTIICQHHLDFWSTITCMPLHLCISIHCALVETWQCVNMCVCVYVNVSETTENRLGVTKTYPGCDGWGFGHLLLGKISWQGNQRETNSAGARLQLSCSSLWWAFEKWSVVEIGFVCEASDVSLVRIIATCLHWLQWPVN